MKNRSWAVSAAGGGLAAVVIAATHGFGLWADDAVRFGDNVARSGVGIARGSALEGMSIMKSLRSGTPEEKVLSKVACSSMNAFMSENSTYQDYAADVRERLNSELPGLSEPALSSLVNRAVRVLTLAEANPGLAVNYVRYCGA
jgi:hypothetical protein